MRVWRAFWKAFRPRRRMSGDWCRVCNIDLPVGQVWEVREHHPNTAEMGSYGGTYSAITYCRRHKPAGAVKA